jgi:hypothetical protein
MLLLAVLAMVVMRRSGQQPLVVALAPLLTVGHYYAVSETWHLTQVEGLVGLPMLLALWYASAPGGPPRPSRLFLSGLMGGLVLVFKLVLLPILLAFWLTTLVLAVRRHGVAPRRLVATVASIVAGLLGPLAVVAAYFAWTGTLGLAWWTWIDFPRRVVAEIPAPSLWRLVGALEWFASRFAWLLALAVIGAGASARRADPVALNLVWWCLLGGAVILAQVQSWWQYHFHLLFVPLGLLAALGVGTLHAWSRRAAPLLGTRAGTGLLLLALVSLPASELGLLARKVVALAQRGWAWSDESRLRYQQAMSGAYVTVEADVAFLRRPESLPGRIYVFGDPLYHFLSGRGQAIAVNGWFMEMAPAEQWEQVAVQLAQARPPYIFVAPIEGELIRRHSARVATLLQTAYRVLREGPTGRWYVRAPP